MTEAPLRRYRWLKWIALACLIWFALVAILWLVWNARVQRQWEREVAILHSRGEPTRFEQLEPAPLPDHLNAAVLYKAAFAAFSKEHRVPSISDETFGEELPLKAPWQEMMDKAAPANAEALRLAHEAARRPQTNWGIPLTSNPRPNLGPSQRELASVLGDTALYHHFAGRDQQALECILTALHLAQATAEDPTLTASLIGVGFHQTALHRLQAIAWNLNVTPDDSTAANRQAVEALITQLLRPRVWKRQMARGVQFGNVEMIEAVADNSPTPLAPLDVSQAIDLLRESRHLVDGGAFPQKPPTVNLRAPSYYAWPYMPARMLDRGDHGDLDSHFLALILALRLYHLDTNHFPADLDALVPHYIPAIPLDPTSAANLPIGYRLLADGKRPLLIASGENGARETVPDDEIPTRCLWGWSELDRQRQRDDQYRDASAWKDPNPPPPGFLWPWNERPQFDDPETNPTTQP